MKEIELSQGKKAIVDDDDFGWLSEHKWYFALGYARRNIKLPNGKRRIVFMHREIAKTPKDKVTDHINGNKLDNRKENLRNVDRLENAWNARKKNKKVTSRYKGVSFFKRQKDQFGKWKSQIQVNKRIKSLGYFHSERVAALSYNKAAIKYFGEFAVLNEVKSMNLLEYQELASRTIPSEKWFNNKVSNFCMGLSGEAGEVVDYLKKVIYHGHELDVEIIKKELGDVLWYVSGLASIMKIDLDDIAKENIKKLETRYPQGFSSIDSKKRVDID